MTNIADIFNYITPRAFFDIGFISLGIFFLYHILRSSGGWRIFIGICIAAALYLVARVFNFIGILWIYKNLIDISLIALIIIFQPEIRKIFEKTASTFRIKEKMKFGQMVTTIITDSVVELSRHRWGAIIVFPGRESIESGISGGIPVNADLSTELITSIFDPHSSGHDGAMLVDGGRITAFALRLPLSTSGKLGQKYGTRHHAALGLSEQTDALILLVSEETGKIMVFSEGTFTIVNTKNEIIRQIEAHWEKTGSFAPAATTRRSKGFALLEMSLSLILGLMLWSSIVLSEGQLKEMSIVVPIEYGVPHKMTIIGNRPTSARLTLSGRASDLARVNAQELMARINLHASTPGERSITVTQGNLQLPAGVNLTDVDPSSFTVNLYSSDQKELPIKPQLIGSLPDGLEIESIECNPQKLKIFLSSEAQTEEELCINTMPIYLQTITQNTKLLSKLITPPGIHPTDNQWPDVVVTIKIRQKN